MFPCSCYILVIQMFPSLHLPSPSSYYNTGLQVGLTFRDRITTFASQCTEVRTALTFAQTLLGQVAFNNLKKINSEVFPLYVQQLEGYAEGSGLSLDSIWVINLMDELNRLRESQLDLEESLCSDEGESDSIVLSDCDEEALTVDVLEPAVTSRIGHCTSIHHHSALHHHMGMYLCLRLVFCQILMFIYVILSRT